MSKMPAKIYCEDDDDFGQLWDTVEWAGSTAYIRADIVEDLVAALREAQAALSGAPNTIGLHTQIDTALATYHKEISHAE